MNKVTDQVVKNLPDFAAEVASLSTDDINGRLAQLAKDTEVVEQAKEDDTELENARELVRELSGPYSDAKKTLRLKTRYLIQLLNERGSQ